MWTFLIICTDFTLVITEELPTTGFLRGFLSTALNASASPAMSFATPTNDLPLLVATDNCRTEESVVSIA